MLQSHRCVFNRLTKPFTALSVLFLLFAFTANAYAQVLEEVIVTAQKRAESLQDVSVSVTALSAEKLNEGAIGRLEEVTAFIPNFTLSETGIGTNIYIRGIGSGINQGFEQSVGLYFDGIYYARAQLARAPIFDLERVEVLRGPQVTLFGNNSIGGAVSVTSAKPTDTFEGSVGFLLEPEHGEKELTAAFSGPLTDNINARLAIRKYDMDGYFRNETLNRDEPQRDYLTTRLTLDFIPDSGAFDMSLKLERSDFDVKGRQIAIIRDEATNYRGTSDFAFVRSPSLARTNETFIGNFDPALPGFPTLTTDFDNPNLTEIFANSLDRSVLDAAPDPTNVNALVFQSIGGEDVAFPDDLTRRGSNNDSSINSINSATATINVAAGEGELKFITGYLDYEYDELCDCDFTGALLIEYQSNETYEQFSQEIRYTSASSDVFEFIVGAYYQQDSLDFKDFVIVLEDSALEEALSFIFRDNANVDIDELVGVAVPRDFAVDSELFAGFAQGTIHFTSMTRLMLGIRESQTEKSGSRTISYTQQDLTTPLVGGQFDSVNFAFGAALNVHTHASDTDRKEKRTSWSIILEQDVTDDLLLYGSIVKGFKGGGFDARSNNPDNITDLLDENGDKPNIGLTNVNPPVGFSLGTFEFDDEEALAFEFGLKARIADRAEINIAYFYTNVKDLQLSVFDGGVGFNVSNAGKATAQGVEVDWRLALSENWFLNGALAWLDFEYKDYQDGLCTTNDLLLINDGDPTTSPSNCVEVQTFVPNTSNPILTPQADLTGATNQYVANFSGSVSLQYERPIGDNLLFKQSVDVNFTDDYNPTQNLDDELQQDAYQVVNLRVAMSDLEKGWEIALLGRNITDKEIVTYANDVPLAASLFGTKTSYGFVQRTRSWALQGKLNF